MIFLSMHEKLELNYWRCQNFTVCGSSLYRSQLRGAKGDTHTLFFHGWRNKHISQHSVEDELWLNIIVGKLPPSWNGFCANVHKSCPQKRCILNKGSDKNCSSPIKFHKEKTNWRFSIFLISEHCGNLEEFSDWFQTHPHILRFAYLMAE